MTPSTPLLTITGLTKVYGAGDNAVHALRGIDLELLRGAASREKLVQIRR